MSKECEICGKTSGRGNQRKLLRGHYNITAKRRFKPNLQPFKKDGQRIAACVKCIRTESKAGR